MRSYLFACVIAAAACGGSSSGSATIDSPNGGGGDGGGGNTDSLGSNPQTVTVTLTNHPTDAAKYSFIAAYQDGAGAWQLAPAPTGDTYSFTVSSPVWGFAWTCIVPNVNLARVELSYFTVAERTSLTQTVPVACSDAAMNVGVSGTVSNTTPIANGGYTAAYATRTGRVQNGAFALEAPAGAHDLFVTAGSLTSGGATVSAVARATATAPTTSADVDWSTNKAVQTQAVTGAPQGATVTTTLYAAGNTQVTLGISGGNTPTVIGLDQSQAVSGDVYNESVATRSAGSTVVAETWTATPAALAYTAPAALGGATSAVAAPTPYPIITTSWNAYTNATGYIWDARQGNSGGIGGQPPLEWTALLGPGYLGATPKFTMPDLSALAGWADGFAFQTGQMVTGSASASASSGGAADFPPVTPAAAGTTRSLASGGWTVTP